MAVLIRDVMSFSFYGIDTTTELNLFIWTGEGMFELNPDTFTRRTVMTTIWLNWIEFIQHTQHYYMIAQRIICVKRV